MGRLWDKGNLVLIRGGASGSWEVENRIKDLEVTCFLESPLNLLTLVALQNLAWNLVHKEALNLGSSSSRSQSLYERRVCLCLCKCLFVSVVKTMQMVPYIPLMWKTLPGVKYT